MSGAGDEEMTEEEATSENNDDEGMCKICYGAEANTLMLPCRHPMCAKCVKLHMLNK